MPVPGGALNLLQDIFINTEIAAARFLNFSATTPGSGSVDRLRDALFFDRLVVILCKVQRIMEEKPTSRPGVTVR